MEGFPKGPQAENLKRSMNPDRVEVQEVGTRTVEERISNPSLYTVVEAGEYEEKIPGSVSLILSDKNQVGKITKFGLLASLTLTAALNIDTEYESKNIKNPLSDPNKLAKNLETIDTATFLKNVKEQVCSTIDGEFMNRFSVVDAEGKESFNPGAFIIPFAISLTEQCQTKVDVQVRVPYHFARTFKEISASNPESRDELVQKLADFIQQEVRNQLVIRGVAGVTKTALVWNKKENVLYKGEPVVDFGKLDISDIVATGTASAEAERSSLNNKEDSLQNDNPENIALAADRLKDFMPLLKSAFESSGVDSSVVENITSLAYEHNLVEDDVNELALMAQEILGEVMNDDENSSLDLAYQLIQEYNNGNPKVIEKINNNPDYKKKMSSLLEEQRGVKVNFTVKAEFEKETVYPVALVLPLFLLLLGSLRLQRSPGVTYPVKHNGYVIKESMPDTILTRTETLYDSVRRRMFSETTPQELEKERSFNDVFDGVQIPYEDKQTLIDHLLVEEVLPDLDESIREPFINYVEIIENNKQFLKSSTREEGITKGTYNTPEEAERKITEDLLEMWEKHDAYLYPMSGIDVKTVLNYRHSEHVVSWAKTLAELFVSLMKESDNTEEFRSLLQDHIEGAKEAGYKNRNTYVKSSVKR